MSSITKYLKKLSIKHIHACMHVCMYVCMYVSNNKLCVSNFFKIQ